MSEQQTLVRRAPRRIPRWLVRLGEASLVAAIAEAIALVRYQVWRQSFTVPLNTAGTDHLYMAELIRAVHDTGWYFTNPHVGAPFGQQLYDFPQTGESSQVFALKVLSLFSSRPFLVMNVYYLLGFAAVAFVTYLVLAHLRFRFLVAAPITVLYTWLPYHIMHGEFHLFRSAYISAPIAVLLLLWAMSWRERFLVDPDGAIWGWRELKANLLWPRVAGAVALCVFVASFETMVTAFTLTAMAVAVVLMAIRHREPSRVAPGVVAIVAMGLTFFLLFLPNFFYKQSHGPNKLAGARHPIEQQIYGLQVAKMVMPVGSHHLKAFADFNEKAYKGETVRRGEAGQALGIIGSLGLLGLLYGSIAFGLHRWKGRDPYDRNRLWGHTGVLTLILILFGTMSGFALVLSTAGLSQIRTWDRVVILIAFCALILVAVALERILAWITRRLGPRSSAATVMACVLLVSAVTVFGLWDTDTGQARSATNASAYRQAMVLTGLTNEIQHAIGPGGMVFQLPVVPFPESLPVNYLQDYEEFLPYLFSNDLRFSYGATKGRPDADWQLKVDDADPGPSLAGLRGLGFDGILIDTHGYADGGAAITDQLTALLGPPTIVTPVQRWRFWNLDTYAQRAGLTQAQLDEAAKTLVGPDLYARLPGHSS